MHLPVAEVDDLVVQQHAVGGEGKAEVLVVDGLQGPGIGHQILHHLPVHQGLAAEEIHLQIPSVTGVGHQEVQGLLADLKGHEGPLPLVFALACKAVAAA